MTEPPIKLYVSVNQKQALIFKDLHNKLHIQHENENKNISI